MKELFFFYRFSGYPDIKSPPGLQGTQQQSTPRLLLGTLLVLPPEEAKRGMTPIYEARAEEDHLKPIVKENPVPVDEDLEAVNQCLAAAQISLKFDIAELWRFAPDQSKRTTGRAGAAIGVKPLCEHVYTMPATMKTYTGRIMGRWNSGFDDSRAPSNHVISPSVSIMFC